MNCKYSNHFPINSTETANNNEYVLSSPYNQSDCEYHLSSLFYESNQNSSVYSKVIIKNNAHDHDHSSINIVHNKTTSVQSEECFTRDNINIDVLNGHDTLNEKSLKLASLNVCGLKRKVLFPEFGTLVNNYQIFCL